MTAFTLVAPLQGWIAPLDEVPDQVFSEWILGDGVAIDPVGSTLHAPCDGVIATMAKHAVVIRAGCGAEILVHIGLETVALAGRGFVPRVQEGASVKAGDPLLDFDLEYLASHAKSLISPIVVANGEAFRISRRNLDREVKVGDFLMELDLVASQESAGAEKTGEESRDVILAATHGIHARPAAVISTGAKRFSADIEVTCRGQRANAKSAMALMTLGAVKGDRLVVRARGKDARQAVEAVIGIVASLPAEAPATPAPPPAVAPSRDDGIVRGICGASGVAVGPIVHLRAADVPIEEHGKGVALEVEGLRRAVSVIKDRLDHAALSGQGAVRDIAAAHIALIDDAELRQQVVRIIEQGKSAGFAWRSALRKYADILRASGDERLRGRASDLLDLERQVLGVIAGVETKKELPVGAILVAEEILPSDLLGVDASGLRGIVTARGGPTSHIAILAAGMNIPALVGAGSAVQDIPEGTEVVLNADEGVLLVNPDAAVKLRVSEMAARAAQRREESRVQALRECRTADGVRIEIFANLSKGAEEAMEAVRQGAEGCGLLRTEFQFMDRAGPPDEEEQRIQYQAICDALDGRDFILRTFDVGGDKPAPYLAFPREDNPALGFRGVRTAELWPDLLRTQLRAAARVQPYGRCKVMLPMISSVNEIVAVRSILDGICSEMSVPLPSLGIMIETPASAIVADQLAAHSDFLSIGTNDLTQYVLAIDRGHRELAGRLDGLHPAVLRLVAQAATAAHAAGKPIGVCGGLAADATAVPLLVGLGIGELSVPLSAIAAVKYRIRGLPMDTCRAVARKALELESAIAVRTLVRSEFP